MDRLRARAQRGLDDSFAHEVALGRRAGADQEGFVGGAHVRRVAVGLRVDGHSADPELAERSEDPDRDLATVRDQDFREERHGARILPEP